MSDTGCPESIGLVTASLSESAGGVLVPVQALAARLHARGCGIHAYGISDNGPPGDPAAWKGTPIHLAKAAFKLGVAVTPDLLAALERSNHNLLHLHGLWTYASVAVSTWRSRLGRPVLISPHGMLDPWALRQSRAKKRVAWRLFEGRNLHGANCLHALNASELEAIRTAGLTNPVAVIPNGIDLPSDGSHFPRPAFLGDDDRHVLLFLGRIHPKKGVLETVEAWGRVVKMAPHITQHWTLVIAGWNDYGAYDKAIADMVNALDIGRHVYLPGAVFGSAKQALLAHAEAFVLASHSEGLPMSILEAWAHRMPAFISRECNLPEGFSSGAAVEVTTDAGKLAEVLAANLDDASLSQRGLAGRALVESRFQWDAIVDRFVTVYHWLCCGGSVPECVDIG